MTKRNLIVLVIGVIILLIIVGWFSYSYFKNKPVVTTTPPPPTATTTAITFSQEEAKTLSRLVGLPSNQIPSVYKEKIELYREKLKNDCLNRKENVKKFLMAFETDKSLSGILKEMKEVTISLDQLPRKTDPGGGNTGFKINKEVIYECLNTNKDEFQKCQSELNGLEINNFPAEDTALYKMPWPPLSTPHTSYMPAHYLLCRALEQKDKNVCLDTTAVPFSCPDIVGQWNFITSVYFQPNCENLCQGNAYAANNCSLFCEAMKNSDSNKCNEITNTNDKLYCNIFTTLNSNKCQNIEPKILERKQPDGSIEKIDLVADCQRGVSLYKAIKGNDVGILKQIKDLGTDKEVIYFLEKLYFGNGSCKNLFDGFYDTYCNLKYGL